MVFFTRSAIGPPPHTAGRHERVYKGSGAEAVFEWCAGASTTKGGRESAGDTKPYTEMGSGVTSRFQPKHRLLTLASQGQRGIDLAFTRYSFTSRLSCTNQS